jgi:hypothetical protein
METSTRLSQPGSDSNTRLQQTPIFYCIRGVCQFRYFLMGAYIMVSSACGFFRRNGSFGLRDVGLDVTDLFAVHLIATGDVGNYIFNCLDASHSKRSPHDQIMIPHARDPPSADLISPFSLPFSSTPSLLHTQSDLLFDRSLPCFFRSPVQ